MDTNAPNLNVHPDVEQQPEGPAFELGDAIAILKRRIWHIIVPTVLLVPVVLAVAMLLPAVWQSEAIVLIEQPDVPPDLVSSTVTSFADQRVQVIEQKVTATDVLVGIMDKFGLYREERRVQPISAVVARMRSAIQVEFISANVTNPRGGRAMQATIAFSISFEYGNARQAQQVTNELVSLFLSENVRSRQRQAEQAADFLAKQADAVAQQISDIERKISALRDDFDGSLPEQRRYNTELLDRANASLRDVDNRIAQLRESRAFLATRLAQTNPFGTYTLDSETILSPADRLKALRTQVTALTAKYTEQHPDVVRMKDEIAALEAQMRSGGGGRGAGSQQPDNALYLQLQAQINQLDVEEAALVRRSESLAAEIAEIEGRLASMPLVEADYMSLVRAREAAQQDFQFVQQKQLAAQLGESLEEERRSERFSVIEPANLPARPARPKRLLILAAGIVLAIGVGCGIAVLAEVLDPSLHGARQLALATGTEPLVVVPFIRTKADRRRTLRRRLAVVLGVVAVLGVGATAVHLKYAPLDVLWLRIERKASQHIGGLLP